MLSMSPYKTIGIVGTRRRDSTNDYIKMLDVFSIHYKEGDRIVSGGCPHGADRFAEKIAKSMQIPITIHYAAWDRIGKSAGFLRNGDIAKDADMLIAMVSDDRTGGTENTITRFKELKKGRIILV
jgi:hypothetical protein